MLTDPAEGAKCQVQFSRETWEVTGWCTVSKARSRRNRYGCLVYQTSQVVRRFKIFQLYLIQFERCLNFLPDIPSQYSDPFVKNYFLLIHCLTNPPAAPSVIITINIMIHCPDSCVVYLSL